MNLNLTDPIRAFVRQLARFTTDLHLQWFLTEHGAIRRLCCQQRCIGRCPVTEVCFDACAKNYGVVDVEQAGRNLGLSPDDIAEIVMAADREGSRDPELRLLMLEACGLPAP